MKNVAVVSMSSFFSVLDNLRYRSTEDRKFSMLCVLSVAENFSGFDGLVRSELTRGCSTSTGDMGFDCGDN